MQIDMFIRQRIAQLRMHQGVSENQMSRELGHSAAYLSNLSTQQKLPSYRSLAEICDYFDITLSQFFDEDCEYPVEVSELLKEAKKARPETLRAVLYVLKNLNKADAYPDAVGD